PEVKHSGDVILVRLDEIFDTDWRWIRVSNEVVAEIFATINHRNLKVSIVRNSCKRSGIYRWRCRMVVWHPNQITFRKTKSYASRSCNSVIEIRFRIIEVETTCRRHQSQWRECKQVL